MTRPVLTTLALAAALAAPTAALAAAGEDDSTIELTGKTGDVTLRPAEGELTRFDVSYQCKGGANAPDSDVHRSVSKTDFRTLLRADKDGRLHGTVAAKNTRFSEDNENKPLKAGKVRFDLRLSETAGGRTKLKGTFTPIAKGCKQRSVKLTAFGR